MKIVNYVKESFLEFRSHVTWPSWIKLQKDTTIVAIATLILAIFLYIVDSVFAEALYSVYKVLR